MFQKKVRKPYNFLGLNVAKTKAMFQKLLRSPSKVALVYIYDNYKIEEIHPFIHLLLDLLVVLVVSFLMMR